MSLFKTLASLVSIVLVLVYLKWQHFLNEPMVLNDSQLAFTIPPASSATSIAKILQQKGLIQYPLLFKILVKCRGIDQQFKAGEYLLRSHISFNTVLDIIVQGKARLYNFCIVEGSSFADIRAVLAKHPKIKQSMTELSEQDIKSQLNIKNETMEGWFYPDTYAFTANTSDISLLKKAHFTMIKHLQSAWLSKSPNLSLKNPYEALILASIVEKETGNKLEMPMVARVYLRRLALGMRLQADPTVAYGLRSTWQGPLRSKHLKIFSSYNTYMFKGLPPGPIAVPSKAALDSVLHPVDSNHLYFVANGLGGHWFSENLVEHNKAVAKYRQLKK